MRSRPAGHGGESGDGRRIVRRPAGFAAAEYWVRPSPGSAGSVAGRAQVRIDLAGDVALQAADDLGLGLSFFRAAFDIGAGGRVRSHAGEYDPPQGMVGLPVTTGVEPVAGDFP